MRYFFMTDIHGMFELLVNALKRINEMCPDEDVTIFFGGDYVDRGPKSKVLDLLMAGPTMGWPGRTRMGDVWIIMKGNHEDMMVAALDGARLTDYSLWMTNGGAETMKSFPSGGVDQCYLDWMRELPTSAESDFHFFCHAGVMPDVPLEDQDPHVMMWIRDRFLNWIDPHPKYIVHGHTPNNAAEILDNRCNLDSAAFWTGVLSVAEFDLTKPGKPINVFTVDKDR